MLPELRTEVPGPRSREMSRELRRWESPNITYVSPDFPSSGRRVGLPGDRRRQRHLSRSGASFGAAAVGHTSPRVVARSGAGQPLTTWHGRCPPARREGGSTRTLGRVCPDAWSRRFWAARGRERGSGAKDGGGGHCPRRGDRPGPITASPAGLSPPPGGRFPPSLRNGWVDAAHSTPTTPRRQQASSADLRWLRCRRRTCPRGRRSGGIGQGRGGIRIRLPAGCPTLLALCHSGALSDRRRSSPASGAPEAGLPAKSCPISSAWARR